MQRSRETPALFFAIKKAFEDGNEWLPYKAPNDRSDDSYVSGRRSYNVMSKIADYALLPPTFHANDFFTVLWNGATPDQRQRIQNSSILTKEHVDPGRWDAMFFSQIRAANQTGKVSIEFIDGEHYSVLKNIADYALKPPTQRDRFTILWSEASPDQQIKIASYMGIHNEVHADPWTEINRAVSTYLPAPPVPFDDSVAPRYRVR